MRTFFPGNKYGNRFRCPGFILPATLAILMACLMLYYTGYAGLSAKYTLLQKQQAEYEANLAQHNREVEAQFGGLYAAD